MFKKLIWHGNINGETNSLSIFKSSSDKFRVEMPNNVLNEALLIFKRKANV